MTVRISVAATPGSHVEPTSSSFIFRVSSEVLVSLCAFRSHLQQNWVGPSAGLWAVCPPGTPHILSTQRNPRGP